MNTENYGVGSSTTWATSEWTLCTNRLPCGVCRLMQIIAVCWKGSNSWGKLFYCGEWLATPGTPFPDYWMPIEPPKEDA